MTAMYTYRQDILDLLLVHGVRPRGDSNPERVREYVRELYKYEIRRLRERYMRQEFSRSEYSARVDALRRCYPELAWPARLWVLP